MNRLSFQGHEVKGQGQAVKVMEVCELDSSWTTEGNYTEIYSNTYYSWTTSWLGFRGHGLTSQGHGNVCRRIHTDRRFVVEDHLRAYFSELSLLR